VGGAAQCDPARRTAGLFQSNAAGADGKVAFFNGSDGSVQLIADVAGYYLAGTPASPVRSRGWRLSG